jgi:aminomethyltransferase
MGQCFLLGPDHATTARALEALVPADILTLPHGKQRYTQFLNAEGGILDDLMVTRSADPAEDGALMLVVNAGCKEADYAHLAAHLPANVRLLRADHRALLALQGPKAAEVLARHVPAAEHMPFMTAITAEMAGVPVNISRSGYTGEDGYEISMRNEKADMLWSLLLANPDVKPIGLGARDSLRLEAGLCLYGHDIDTTTSPIEAALAWSIQKRRREEGGFPGAERIQRELHEGPARRRVGIRPEGRQPAREGSEIMLDGRQIGTVTSGGFGPSVNGPVAMGYVEAAFAAEGTAVTLLVRGKELPATIAPLAFVPSRFYRGPAAVAA